MISWAGQKWGLTALSPGRACRGAGEKNTPSTPKPQTVPPLDSFAESPLPLGLILALPRALIEGGAVKPHLAVPPPEIPGAQKGRTLGIPSVPSAAIACFREATMGGKVSGNLAFRPSRCAIIKTCSGNALGP